MIKLKEAEMEHIIRRYFEDISSVKIDHEHVSKKRDGMEHAWIEYSAVAYENDEPGYLL